MKLIKGTHSHKSPIFFLNKKNYYFPLILQLSQLVIFNIVNAFLDLLTCLLLSSSPFFGIPLLPLGLNVSNFEIYSFPLSFNESQ